MVVQAREGNVSYAVLSPGRLIDEKFLDDFTATYAEHGDTKVKLFRCKHKFACNIRLVESSVNPGSSSSDAPMPMEVSISERALPPQNEVAERDTPPAFTEASRVDELRRRLGELRAPIWGTKAQLLQRIRENTTKRNREAEEQRMSELRHQARLEGEARVLQPQGCQASTTLPVPEPPTKMAEEPHRLTHTPIAAWCEHCMQGKAKAGPH
eukprot:984709-Amphidinium_carterae.1